MKAHKPDTKETAIKSRLFFCLPVSSPEDKKQSASGRQNFFKKGGGK